MSHLHLREESFNALVSFDPPNSINRVVIPQQQESCNKVMQAYTNTVCGVYKSVAGHNGKKPYTLATLTIFLCHLTICALLFITARLHLFGA